MLALLAVWLLASALLQASANDQVVEPPLIGRPRFFSGAVGTYRVSMRADPMELEAEDPLTLTVRITGTGSLDRLPRPNLRLLPAFEKNFHIEDLQDRSIPAEKSREFDFMLRPRTAAVKEISTFPFVYFKPGAIPDYRGYETTYAPAIPLTVRPRSSVKPSEIQGQSAVPHLPERFYRLAEPSRIIRSDWLISSNMAPVLVVVLLLPPGLCGCIYWVWYRRHPNSARLMQARRTSSGKQALRALEQTKGKVSKTVDIVAEYLRKRFDLAAAEPTPIETAAHLERLGISTELIQRIAHFFRNADRVRFGPDEALATEDWTATARDLICALEGVRWR